MPRTAPLSPVVIDLNHAEWQFAEADAKKPVWRRASAPGTVHMDLLAHREIPDPYFGTQERDVAWVAERDWLYRTTFTVGEDALERDRVELAFDGLDTLCDIAINGLPVASTDNMFVPYRFNVKKLLQPGENELEIRFRSPVVEGKRRQEESPLRIGGGPYIMKMAAHLRKAQYSFGWDWGPVLPTSGVWRPARIEARSGGRIESAWIETASIEGDAARVTVKAEAARIGRGALRIEARLHGHGFDETVAWDVPESKTSHAFMKSLSIPDVRLWWPNDIGEPALYTLEVRLLEDDVVLDESTRRVGVRTVKLERKADKAGESFVFRINGRRVYCKGANWIPADNLTPRVTPERYDTLLSMAADAHMNMIRIWGGGIYEDPVFYELCDEKGLMVWQDFMFACSEYPQSAAFLRSVKREAEAAVRRLRRHASVVIWCGNNECQMMHAKTCDARFKGSRIFYDLLPPICEDLDGTRPYWPGSPWAGPHPNAETHGDQHYWNVWHGAGDPEYYLDSQCRFVSEFGMQAMPCTETLRESIPAEELYDGSPSMNSHNKGGMGPGKLARYTTTVLPTPKSIDEFAWFSQLMQARAIRIGVEHWRRMKWRNAGALIWQLNDCWPVASWAMIDGADRPKVLLYASKRFFDPVLVSANRYGRTIEVGVTNDTDLEIKGKVICRVTDVATGEVAREQAFDVTVKPNSAKKVCAKAPDELGFTDIEGQFLWLEWVSGKRIVAMNHFDPAPYRYMPLRDAKLKTKIRKGEDGGVDITLETPTTARGVTLSLGNDVVGHFKDNYLDLYPNRPVTVRLETEATVKTVKGALAVKHLLMER